MRKEYAVLAYFDFETEVKLKQFWRELYELGITDYGVIPKNRRPHITLADYQDIDVEKLSLMIEQYFTHQAQVTIQLNTLGSFIGRKMLYLAPTMTKELLDLHGNYHEAFEQFNQNPNSYYLPQRWVPHCSVAGHLTEETLLQAFEYCQKNISCIQATIMEIGLVEVFFNEAGSVVKERLILSKTWKVSN